VCTSDRSSRPLSTPWVPPSRTRRIWAAWSTGSAFSLLDSAAPPVGVGEENAERAVADALADDTRSRQTGASGPVVRMMRRWCGLVYRSAAAGACHRWRGGSPGAGAYCSGRVPSVLEELGEGVVVDTGQGGATLGSLVGFSG
jgi:hypothetical protein